MSIRLLVTAFGLLALVAAPFLVDAQAPPVQAPGATQPVLPDVRFEVASIRRNKEAEAQRAAVPIYVPVVPGRAQTLPGGLVRGLGMSVRELVRDAYGYRNRAHGEIVGFPDWTDKERYDLEAKAEVSETDVSKIAPGMPARVILDARNEAVFCDRVHDRLPPWTVPGRFVVSVAVELPGHGRRAHERARASMDAYAEAVAACAQHLGVTVDQVALTSGLDEGIMATAIVHLRPSKVMVNSRFTPRSSW